MTSLFFDIIAATLRTSHEALERGCLVNIDNLDFKFVNIGTIIVLGISNRRIQGFLDDSGTLFRAEVQDIERLRDTANRESDPLPGVPFVRRGECFLQLQ